jgi:HD-like signal output (HDOD) protein
MYIAGLFHDIGKLFLVTHFPDLYEDLLAANSRDDRRLCEQERCVFGIDHEKVGSMILRTWCFPKAVQMACFQSGGGFGCAEPSVGRWRDRLVSRRRLAFEAILTSVRVESTDTSRP